MGKKSGKRSQSASKSAKNESSAASGGGAASKKLVELCENLSSPDESRRYEATVLLANLFIGSKTDYRLLKLYTSPTVLNALSLRLVDQSEAIKICAAGAIRNIASHDDQRVSSVLLRSELMESIVLIVSQAITDGCHTWSDDDITASDAAYVFQIVNSLINLCANQETASALALDIDTDLLVSILQVLKTTRDAGKKYRIRDALAKLLLVMTDECPEAIQSIVESQNGKSLGSWLCKHCQELLADLGSVGADDLSLVGAFVNISSQNDDFFETQSATFRSIFQLLPGVIAQCAAYLKSDDLNSVSSSCQSMALAAEVLANLIALMRPAENEEGSSSMSSSVSTSILHEFTRTSCVSICGALGELTEGVRRISEHLMVEASLDTDSSEETLRMSLLANDRIVALIGNLIDGNEAVWVDLCDLNCTGILISAVLSNSHMLLLRLRTSMESAELAIDLPEVFIEPAKSSLCTLLLLLTLHAEIGKSKSCHVFEFFDQFQFLCTCLSPDNIESEFTTEVYSLIMSIISNISTTLSSFENVSSTSTITADTKNVFLRVI